MEPKPASQYNVTLNSNAVHVIPQGAPVAKPPSRPTFGICIYCETPIHTSYTVLTSPDAAYGVRAHLLCADTAKRRGVRPPC